VVPVLVIVLLVKYVVGEKSGGAGAEAMTPEAIADRLRPVGSVVLAQASGPRTLKSGEEVYKLACGACHTAGVAGAPKTGDAAAWARGSSRATQTLVTHAVARFQGNAGQGWPMRTSTRSKSRAPSCTWPTPPVRRSRSPTR